MANNPLDGPRRSASATSFQQGFNIGKNADLDRYADPDERRLQLLDGRPGVHGKHTSKAGLEFNRVSDYVNNLYDGNGNYSYDYSLRFHRRLSACHRRGSWAALTSHTRRFITATGRPSAIRRARSPRASMRAMLPTTGAVLPNLTLTLGARYEYEYVPPIPSPTPETRRWFGLRDHHI